VATLIENNMDAELIYDSERLELKTTDHENYNKAVKEFRLHDALGEIWKIVAKANQYIDEQKPWVQVKKDPEEFLETMTTMVASIHNITWLLQPFMPETAQKIADTFGDDLLNKEIPENYHFKIKKGGVLFPRL
jgi:methionyl-tRNA synthetase